MRALESFMKWGRSLMQRAAAATGVAREFRDVFDLMGVPAYRAFYENGIFVWKQLYRGAYPP